jgi:membrane-bound lytic murein transglycosylase A
MRTARVDDCSSRPARGRARLRGAALAALALAAAWAAEPAAQPASAEAGGGAAAPFSTRHARYAPVGWNELPGWRDDPGVEALQAFREGCAALARRPVWDELCRQAADPALRAPERARSFFEQAFELYRVHETDRDAPGVITGYFEPLLNGSRRPGGPYAFPVYAVPGDMLYLDSRRLPRAPTGQPIQVRIEGREVIPLAPGEAGVLDPRGVYALELGAAAADVRDKRIRVRAAGQRIVAYPTRQEIERGGLADARVIAWVDSPDALYLLHVQGSGKVRLPGGEIVRLAYAEQNGHPFTPKILGGAAPKTRGLPGVGAPSPAADVSPEVERLIAFFLAQDAARRQGGPVVAAPAPPRPAAAERPAAARPASPGAAPALAGTSPEAFYAGRVSSETDRSYVFFREIPDGPKGPIGALGVPLTAGRSIAVDPRTTPLGVPVFISAHRAGAAATVNRLMVAQDTGGAIRGAVRADYFWGFGREAGSAALRMKDELRLWVLLPKGLQVGQRQAMLARTRGLGGAPAAADCLVEDPEFCVE